MINNRALNIEKQKLSKFVIDGMVGMALIEDCYNSDITTNCLISKEDVSEAHIISKEAAILCGVELATHIFKRLDKNIKLEVHHKDGDILKKGTKILSLKGKTRTILTGERPALNFLSYLSGIASNANKFVKAAKPYKVQILSTRKTTPGMRKLEKYAVLCGGGVCHRTNLKEMVIIKDNHREACYGTISFYDAILKIKRKHKKPLAVEVDTLPQFRQAIKAKPDIIMLDNMSIAEMKYAVEFNKEQPRDKRVLIEASGGIGIRKVKDVAKIGVNRISVGALTHTRKNINMSLEIVPKSYE